MPKDPLFEIVDKKLGLQAPQTFGNRELPDPDKALEAAEAAMYNFLSSLGIDMEDTNTIGTPIRVAKMYQQELLSGYTMPEPNLTSFAIDDQGSDQVTVTGIPVHSLCAHHLMPIAGFAAVSAFFIPDEEEKTNLLGLSKFARVVEMYSRRLQTQEIIGRQVANYILDNTKAVWVGVHIKADHFCMSHRGVRIHGSKTITTKFRRKEVPSDAVTAYYKEDNKFFYISESRSEELKRSFLDEVHSV